MRVSSSACAEALCDSHLHGSDFRLPGPWAWLPCCGSPKSAQQGRIRLRPAVISCSRRSKSCRLHPVPINRSLPFPAAIASVASGYPSAPEQGRFPNGLDRFRFRRNESASLSCSKHIPKLTLGGGVDTVGRTYSAESCLPWRAVFIRSFMRYKVPEIYAGPVFARANFFRRKSLVSVFYCFCSLELHLVFWQKTNPSQRKRANR